MKIHFTVPNGKLSKKDIKTIQENIEGKIIYELNVHCVTTIREANDLCKCKHKQMYHDKNGCDFCDCKEMTE